MKVKNEETAKFYKQCLAARELEAFAKLCECSDVFDALQIQNQEIIERKDSVIDFSLSEDSEHSNIAPVSTPNSVSLFLEKYRKQISQGKLDPSSDKEFLQDLKSTPSNMQEAILETSKKYALYSKVRNSFQEASSEFDSTLLRSRKTGKISVDRKKLEEFNKDIKRNPYLKKFQNNFEAHSRTYLGCEHYKRVERALAPIALSHPEITNSKSIRQLPKMYGSEIRQAMSIRHQHTLENLANYKKKTPGKIKEGIYSIGKSFKPSGKSLAALALAGAITIGGYSTIVRPAQEYTNEFNNINIENALENGYDLKISNDTLTKIKSAREMLDTLKNSQNLPDRVQLQELRDLIDDNMDLIFSDLVPQAIEAEKDWQVTSVETEYDQSRARDGSEDQIVVEYIDENNHKQTATITNFDTKHKISNIIQAFNGNDYNISGTFHSEKNLDSRTGKGELNFNDTLEKAYSSDITFLEKSKNISDILIFLEKQQNIQEILAAKGMVYSNGILGLNKSLSFDLSNKKDADEKAPSTSNTPTATTIEQDDDLER